MPSSFYQTISEAVAHFASNGYDSEAELLRWLATIRDAAQADLVPEAQVEEELRKTFTSVFQRLVDDGGLLKANPGMSRFTIDRVRPQLREELNRRTMASAELIRLNRDAAIEATMRRFAGWATSVPPGGTNTPVQRKAATETRAELAKLGFVERRVAVDQGHKFAANLSAIVAKGGNAIAARWNQHWTRNPRHSHRERNGGVYLVRDSWARERGLVKPGVYGYVEDVTQPGEEIFCRCTWTWLYHLRQLPEDMITRHGREELERVRRELTSIRPAA